MKKAIFTLAGLLALLQFANAQLEIPDCTEPYISEYMEGSNKNQAIEIYNPTDSFIDLSNYSIKVFSAGPNNPNVIQLGGFLPPKEVHVCGHPQADPTGILPKCDATSSQLKFDGDDAVGLYRNDTLIDIIGEIGVNPGNTGWMVGTGFTKNNTLVRGYDVKGPTPYWNISQLQWQVFANDDTLQLGKHESICAQGLVYFLQSQTNQIVEGPVTVLLELFAENPDSSAIIVEIGHPNGYNCLDPMGYATFDDDYTVIYGQPIMVQIPGLSFGNFVIPIQIFQDNIPEPDNEAICFKLVPGPGYNVPSTYEWQYKHSLIILDDGDTGIEELMEEKVKVYPTVTDGLINIGQLPGHVAYKLMIYDVFGKEIYSQQTQKGGSPYSIDVSGFSGGMYVMAFEGEGWKITRKFIKN